MCRRRAGVCPGRWAAGRGSERWFGWGQMRVSRGLPAAASARPGRLALWSLAQASKSAACSARRGTAWLLQEAALLWRLRNPYVVELAGVSVQDLPGGGKAGLLLMVRPLLLLGNLLTVVFI